MPIFSSLQRVIASWVIAALFITQTFNFDLGISKPVLEEYGIVAILVESGIYDSAENYDGLIDLHGSYLNDDTLWERIDRYAYDVQSSLAMTKALIIEVDPDEEVKNVVDVLERLYFDGDDIEDEKNHLTGVVVVGDVPLPVVTKGGNKFLSMLPYTDFEDKVYIFSDETGNFERNTTATDLTPEIWHGVIVAPSEDEDGMVQLAEYFDKNHLYHLGVTEYSEFDQKVFYGDLVAEEKALNDASFSAYERFLDNWETIAYSRYTKYLVKDLFDAAGSSALSGDGIDNDGDGLVDEDPEDGIDNDGDDLIDEDVGDLFEGIDNDGDGWIDEDGTDDNDNDGDGFVDEDPPGDLNGDGCPGVCNLDDDGDSVDPDDDGWPTGFENLYGWDPESKSSPFLFSVPEGPLRDNLVEFFTDEDPLLCSGFPCIDLDGDLIGNGYYDSSCYDEFWVLHPEWDDDEDGYCDEDSDQDNDADFDGVDDEDRAGNSFVSDDAFLLLPDVQTKNLFEQLTNRYHEMFEKLIAQVQGWIDYTGRYTSQYLNEDGITVSDVDSPMSLIGKKDEYSLVYLRGVNDAFEEQINAIVGAIQEDVKLISNIEITLTLVFEPEEDDPDFDGDGEPDPHSYTSTPIYFLNNSASSRSRPFDTTILGQSAQNINNVEDCSAYMGTYDGFEGGSQLVEGLRVYDLNTAGEYEEQGEGYGGCYGNYSDMSIYGDEVDSLDFCFPEVAENPVKSLAGTEEILPGDGDASLTPDYRACNDFRELTGFFGDAASVFPGMPSISDSGYFYYAENFVEKIDELFSEPHDEDDDLTGDGVYDQDDLAIEIEEFVQELNDDGAYDIPYTDLDDIQIYDSTSLLAFLQGAYDETPDYPEEISLAWILETLGYDSDSQDALVDFLIGEETEFSVEMTEVDSIRSIEVDLDTHYIKSSDWSFFDFASAYTSDPDDAHSISSVYYHTEPKNETITAQVEAQFSKVLPIDDPRYVSFQDQSYEYQEIYYPNVFDAEDIDEFLVILNEAGLDIASVPGGILYANALTEYFDDFVNQDELADVIAWTNMNIDEKHEYVISNYLGSDDAYISDPEDGYEIAYLVGDGDQTGYDFSFNAYAKVDDEDLEFNNPDLDYNPDLLPESENQGTESEGDGLNVGAAIGLTVLEAIGIFKWIEEMIEWVDSLSAITEGVPLEFACGGDCFPYVADTLDMDDNGIPDSAEAGSYAYIELEVLSDKKLSANGTDTIDVQVSVLDDYDQVNTSDSFSEIELSVIGGEDYGSIYSANPITVYQGQAVFTIISSQDPGTIELQATSTNNNLYASNIIYIESVSKEVKLYTYDIETVTLDNVYTSTELADVVLTSDDEDVLVSVDAETGEIEIYDDDVEIEVLAAEGEMPTRIGFNYEGELIGFLYVVPDVWEIAIGGQASVSVTDTNAGDNYTLAFDGSDELLLWEGDIRPIVSVMSNGQIFVREDLGVELELVSENFASDIAIMFDGVKLAEVSVSGISSERIEILATDYLSFWDKVLGWLGISRVFASDMDGDELEDLYEFTIGTDLYSTDTDSDFYSDWDELQSGYDPLSSSYLFTDLNTDHEAYNDILELYLRGIISGYADGSFRPEQAITREEFTKLNLGGICLYCDMYSEETREDVESEYSSDPFPDSNISEGLYYCVADSKNLGLVSGYKGGDYPGYFLPNNNISRAEAAKVILEAATKLDSSFDSADYLGPDKPWYYNYVIKAQGFGLFPEDRFIEVDHYNEEAFLTWFESEIEDGGEFISWLADDITRAEFAMMIVNLIEIYDCRGDDADGDGLSDSEEVYVYGTDPYDPDTDDGGVTDFVEVVNDMDPLYTPDDSDYFDFYDGDEDYLSEDEENDTFFTLYNDPDTDDGGIIDGMEVLYGTDPLSGDDDYFGFDQDSGVFVIGDNWQRDYVYASTDYVETIVTENIIYISEIPADGYSSLYLRAEIIGEDGWVDTSDNSSIVEFIITDPGNDYAEIAYKNVQVVEGVAETEIVAETTSGEVEVTAEISPVNYSVIEADVDVYPGSPYSMEFVSTSTVMAAGGVNKMNVLLMLYDRYGNIAYNDPYVVTLDIAGGGELADVRDEDAEAPGVQATTFDGYVPFSVISSEGEGVITLTAEYEELSAEMDIEVMEGITLAVEASYPTLTANGVDSTPFGVYATDSDGNLLTGFNPVVTLSVVDSTYGFLDSADEVELVGGMNGGWFTSSTVAGDAYVMASAIGIDPGSVLITTEPGPVHELKLLTVDGSDLVVTGEEKDLLVKAYDENGNFAYNDSATEIDLRITDLTQEYGELSDETVYTDEGAASFSVDTGDLSGVMNIVASSSNLVSGILSLDVRNEVTNYDIEDMDPQVLYASLLGAPVGQVTHDDYFAGWFLFNGKTQAVSSLLDYPDPHKRLMQLDFTGKSTLIEGNFLIHEIIPSGDDDLPMKTVWQDDPANLTLAEVLILLDKTNGVHESEDLLSESESGAYIELQTTDDDYALKQKFSKSNDSISLLQDDNEVVSLSANGQIKLYSANYLLEINEDYDYPAFSIYHSGKLVATALLVSDFAGDVTLLERDDDWTGWRMWTPGVYMKQYESEEYSFEVSLSGNSSASPIGYYLVDKLETLPSSQAPSLGYSSLDDAQDQGGIGFEGDNKNILFFSAGNTAGESNKYAVSEIGVLLGDPTIALAETNSTNGLGYTKDVGRMILSGDEPIQDIVALDYNDDNLQDLLIAYENGEIKLLQNYNSEDRFQDRGNLLNIASGILSFDHADFDQDGYEDLVIATEDSCIAGEVCVDLYKNNAGEFERINLDLDTGSQVYQIRAADMNDDSYPDIVVSDNVGTIKLFYNSGGEIDPEGQYIGNLGVKVDSSEDLGSEIYVYYDGVPELDVAYSYTIPIDSEEGFGAIDSKFEDIDIGDSLDALLSSSVGSLTVTADEPDTKEEVSFISSVYDENFVVTKYGSDLNGDILEPDDEIEYVISITNSSGADIDNLYVSDIAPSLLNTDLESFRCLNSCGEIEISETGVATRPFVISGISIGAGETAEIAYSSYVLSVPKVNVTIGHDFDDYHNDDYLDIAASPEGNPTGQVVYFYSNGSYIENDHNLLGLFSGLRIMNYTQELSEPPDTEEESDDMISEIFVAVGLDPLDFETDSNENSMPDDLEFAINEDFEFETPNFVEQVMDLGTNDADGDGLVDSWDSVPTAADISGVIAEGAFVASAVASVVESVLAAMMCGGGCIANPVNIAFLVPGLFNVWGVPNGFDMGWPVFGVMSTFPFICTGPICYISQVFRLYFSVTTTLGLATAFCVGPYPSQLCWAFNLPILQATGICDQINSAISSVISAASSIITNGPTMLANAIPGVNAGDAGGGGSGGLTSYSVDDYTVSAITNMNIQVPGFPSVFTEWWKKQKQEILQLIDLPDIYFIYPDVTSIASASIETFQGLEKSDLNSLSKFLTVLNALPIIQIETETVTFKIPTLTKEEFLKYEEESKIWALEAKEEVLRVRDDWLANGFSAELDGVEELIANVEANIQTINEYMELPKIIFEFRNEEIELIEQIICYLDAIISFMGGYILVNKDRIEQWKQFIKDVINAFATWQLLFDVALSYQDSCDKCTNSRGSLIEIMMKLFMFIPEPPVIDLPKLPDIVIDVSEVQAGLTITWPEIDFDAEPLILPEIPSLTLPDLPTLGLGLSIPSIPLLPSIPDLPELPDLPPLPIPNLPDIPPPPDVPSLDMSIQIALKIVGGVLKIVCLVLQGIIPTNEIMLKTKVEDLTQRPLDVLFPIIDFGLSFSAPAISFDFVKKIEIIARLNLQMDMTFIVDAAQFAADIANSATTFFTSGFNNLSSSLTDMGQDIMDAPADIVDELPTDLDVDVDVSGDGAGSGLDAGLSYNDPDSEILKDQASLLAQMLDNLDASMQEYNENLPEEISVIGEQDYIAVEDLPDYETIAQADYSDFSNLISDTPVESLIDLKDQLIAYVDDNESFNSQIDEWEDWDGFQRLLVQNEASDYLLVDYTEDQAWTNAYDLEEVLNDWTPLTNEDLTEIETSMADAVDNWLVDASENDVSNSSADYDAPAPMTKGLFIYDPVEEVNDRLINYTAEAESPSKLAILDIDNDDDDDIVYNYGGNVYLKENYTEEPAVLGHYTGVPRLADIDYFLPEMASVNLFTSGDVGNEEASMTFSGDVESEAVGYEVYYYESLIDIDEGYLPVGIVSLIDDVENEQVVFYDDENEYILGDEIETSDESQVVVSDAEDLIMIPEDAEFMFSDIERGFAYIEDTSDAVLKNSYYRTVVYENGSTVITGGDTIHTLEDSEITIDLEADSDFTLVLTANTIFPINTTITSDQDLKVEKGAIEIIDISELNRQDEQTLVDGMLIYEEDLIEVTNGTTEIALMKGGTVEVTEGQTYMLNELGNFSNPYLDLTIDNGTYYAQIWSIDADGVHSTTSNTVLLAPQICADDNAPYPDAGVSTKELPVFNTLTLDASGSFDTDSAIMSYYWDTDLDTDSDFDGDTENDADYYHDIDPTTDYDLDGISTNDWDDPYMEVGPYNEIGTHQVMLWVTDEAGNSSSQLITIEVYVPDIFIDSASSQTGVVQGYIDPEIEDMPFILIRDRDSVVTQIITDADAENGKYYTEADGTYEITDVDIESKLLILNSQGDAVAELNPDNGQILIIDERYAVDILATDLEWPTRLIVYEIASGEILQSILFVTNANTDVYLQEVEFDFDRAGVQMKIFDEGGFEFSVIGASDPLFPGSIEVLDGDERHALVGSDGNIYLIQDGFDLSLKEAESLSEPLVIQLEYDSEVLAEIYIDVSGDAVEATTLELGLPDMSSDDTIVSDDSDGGGIYDDVELVYGWNPLDPADDAEDSDGDGINNFDEVLLGTDPYDSDSDNDGLTDLQEVENGLDPNSKVDKPFEDISTDDPLFFDIYDMVGKGILSGYIIDGLDYFLPDQEINRAEFTKIMLAILCIVPRDEAYFAPDVFNDISDESLWYYDETKESYLRGFITGYLAEIDANGMTPFKPDATITRAEAVKIVLEALNEQGFLDLGYSEPSEPWWDPYIEIAQDLTPYLVSDSGGSEQYLLTAEEASDPLAEITRYEFVEMSVRALRAYNCYLIDSDHDGLYDWDEENIYGSDPFDPDTDDGGVWDGEEVWRGSDPLDAVDDYPEIDEVYDGVSLLIDLDENVYLVGDECLICPCPSSIENSEQVMAGDIIYTAITNTDNSEFFSVSNQYQVE